MSVDEVRAVHFVLDSARASMLQERWIRSGMKNLPLELIECPDRRLVRACLELASDAAEGGQTEVTILLPRRAYGRFLSRLLHDQTAERISASVSQLEHVTATIVPFDVEAELDKAKRGHEEPFEPPSDGEVIEARIDHETLAGLAGTTPITSLHPRERARVAGRVKSVTVKPWGDIPTLQVQLTDDEGRLEVAFLGRRQIAGLNPGSRIVVDGTVTERRGQLTMINPDYEFVSENPAPA
jgi:hypothetical protein